MSVENIQSDLSEIIKEFNLCKNNNNFTENIKMLRNYKYNILDIRNIKNDFEKNKFPNYEKYKKYEDFLKNFKNKNYNFFSCNRITTISITNKNIEFYVDKILNDKKFWHLYYNLNIVTYKEFYEYINKLEPIQRRILFDNDDENKISKMNDMIDNNYYDIIENKKELENNIKKLNRISIYTIIWQDITLKINNYLLFYIIMTPIIILLPFLINYILF